MRVNLQTEEQNGTIELLKFTHVLIVASLSGTHLLIEENFAFECC